MTSLYVIICILFVLLFFYYNQYTELYTTNQKNIETLKHLKSKVKYLQTYKNDISKTFKILNNELTYINEKISNTQTNQNISSLTPEMLNTLFETMTNFREHLT